MICESEHNAMLARTIRRISGRAYVLNGTWRTIDETNYQAHRHPLFCQGLVGVNGWSSELGWPVPGYVFTGFEA